MLWISILAKKNESTPKNAKNNNLLKTKGILNIKISVKGGHRWSSQWNFFWNFSDPHWVS